LLFINYKILTCLDFNSLAFYLGGQQVSFYRYRSARILK
jgi:hypothetical protein